MKNLVAALLICLSPFTLLAQDAAHQDTKHKHKTTKSAKTAKTSRTAVPPWAAAHKYDASAHVYFPDYYTYYDPNRGGYVFWNNGKYTFTPALPPFLEKVDLGKSRIQILKGLSLDLHPEQNYPYYMKLYPPDNSGNSMVPVPVPGNPAGR
jgi:hypothetical protein